MSASQLREAVLMQRLPPIIGWKVIMDGDEIVLELEYNPFFIPGRSVRYSAGGKLYTATKLVYDDKATEGVQVAPQLLKDGAPPWDAYYAAQAIKQYYILPDGPTADARGERRVLSAGRVGLPSATHNTTTWPRRTLRALPGTAQIAVPTPSLLSASTVVTSSIPEHLKARIDCRLCLGNCA